MIQVKGNVTLDPTTMKADASWFADTKSEVQSATKFPGIPDGYSIEMGSSVMTAEGELAFMKSDGTWNWL